MTTVSQIITDAFRKGNLIAAGASPTSDEQTEALRYLSRIVKSVFGTEAGENLLAFPIGNANIVRPSGYPWWGAGTPDDDWFVPENIRIMCNLTESVDLYLHPEPNDGSRFALIDVAGNLATYPVEVFGNGRTIETATSVVLDTNNTDSEWFYRADLGNWQKYAPIAIDDTFPFPEEFDDFFIAMLALSLNPGFGTQLDGQTQALMTRAQKQLRARYRQSIPTMVELALLRMPKVAADRDSWANNFGFFNPNDMFNKGWPF